MVRTTSKGNAEVIDLEKVVEEIETRGAGVLNVRLEGGRWSVQRIASGEQGMTTSVGGGTTLEEALTSADLLASSGGAL